jgi:hypothetical protein
MVSVYIPSQDPNPLKRPCSEAYSRWLSQYAIFAAVQLASASPDRSIALGEVRDVMLDAGLLDGYSREGDVWVTNIYRAGPFERAQHGTRYVLQAGIEAADYPEPRKRPPVHGSPPPQSATPPASPPRGRRA